MHKVKLFHTINGNLNRIYCNKIWKRLRCTSDANDDSSTGNNNKCKATEGFRVFAINEDDIANDVCLVRDMDQDETNEILTYYCNDCYKNPEYHMYNNFAYYNVIVYLQNRRVTS